MHATVKLFLISLLTSACLAQNGTIQLGNTISKGNTIAAAPQTVLLGEQYGGSTTTPGANSVTEVPILLPTAPAGYALQSFGFNVGTAAGNVIAGIYAQGSANCPTNTSNCAGAQTCLTGSITPTAGINIISAASFSSCGISSASTYLYLTLIASSASLTLKEQATSYCPGTPFNGLKASPGSFALPSTMGTQTQSTFCPQIWAVFTCVAACGSVTPPLMSVNYTGATVGNVLTAAALKASSTCYNGVFGGTLTAATFVNSPTQAFNGTPFSCGAAIPSGSVAVQRDSAHTDFWTYALTNQSSRQADMLGWWDNTTNTMASGDSCDLMEIEGGNTWTFHLVATTGVGIPTIQVERSGNVTASIGKVSYTLGHWYALVGHDVAGGISVFRVYDTTGTQIATQAFTANVGTPPVSAGYVCPDGVSACGISDVANNNPPSGFKELNEGSCASTAGTMFYGPVLWDATGQFSSILGTQYGELFFPDSPANIGATLSAKVRSGEIPSAQFVEKFQDGKDLHEKAWYSYALHRYLS